MWHLADLEPTLSDCPERGILVAESQRLQSWQMQLSNRSPYRQVAYLLAGLYCAGLMAIALAIRLRRRVAPEHFHRRLAEIFHYVPEMALHKSIELEAILHHRFKGKGLDLGCGYGLVGGVLIEAAGLTELHGVDHNERCRDSALANGYASFTQSDIQKLSLADESFDYAVSICVMEHVPDLAGGLAEVARVLRPGGRFVFSTVAPAFRRSTLGYRVFSLLGMGRRAEAFKLSKDIRSMQFHYLSPARWRRVLAEAGFGDVEVRPIFSSGQLLVYDLMNIQVYLMRFYFADKLATLLARRPSLRRLMTWVTEVLSARFGKTGQGTMEDDATHYLIACVKRAGAAPA